MSHQDQDWESKAWEKHRELGTISVQHLRAIKRAQPWAKPQPCHGTCNLPCQLLLAVIRAVGHPRGSPRTHPAVRKVNPGQPRGSHRLSAVPGTLVGSIRILMRVSSPLPAGGSSDHTALWGETRICGRGSGGAEGREARGDPA